MELRQLRYLVTLAEELHFTRAAAQEHIAVGAFSEQISRLERELGTPLFLRTTRQVELTEAGAAIVLHARRVLREVAELAITASGYARSQAGMLSVGLGAADVHVTPDILRTFTSAHPEVALHAHQYGYDDPSAGLRSGASDVAVLWGPQTTDGWLVHQLRTEPRVAALPSDHVLATRKSLCADDLLGEAWLDVPASDPVWRDFWLLAEHRDGGAPRMGSSSSTRDGLLELVSAGQGISLLPRVVSQHVTLPGVCFIPVEDAAHCQILVAAPVQRLSPLVGSFVAAALAVAGRSTGSSPGAG